MKSRSKKNNLTPDSSKLFKNRTMMVYFCFFLMSVAVLLRLIDLQLLRHKSYDIRAADQYQIENKLNPKRGTIFDRYGNRLACSLTNFYSIAIHPYKINDTDSLDVKLMDFLPLSKSEINSKLKSGKKFVWLYKKIKLSPDQEMKLKKMNPEKVYYQQLMERIHPYGMIGGQILGFVGQDNQGMSGIEAVFDGLLVGKPGWEILQKGTKGQNIHDPNFPREEVKNGGQVQLAIDINIQSIAEEELARGVENSKASGGMIAVVKPKTGEVLALASNPNFNPDDYGKFKAFERKNRAITDAIEPGSTLKIVPFIALVEGGNFNSEDMVFCYNGKYSVADRIIKDAHPYGYLTEKDVLVKSSNIGTVQLSERLSKKDFYTWIRDLGFNQRTGIELTGEFAGLLNKPSEWSGVSQANFSIGQGYTVTTLQLAMAYAAIANGGELLKPLLVLSVRDENGEEHHAEKQVIRRIMRPTTSKAMSLMLEEVVNRGTGKKAMIKGERVAGKTGTAQMVNTENWTYYNDRFTSSFAGFMPVENPEYVVVVVIEDPRHLHYGGDVAAPVFRKTLERILSNNPLPQNYENSLVENKSEINKVENQDQTRVPAMLNLPLEQAKELAENQDIKLIVEGNGDIVFQQDHKAGCLVKKGEIIHVTVGDYNLEGKELAIPDVKGMNLRDAIKVMSKFGIEVEIHGQGLVKSQSLKPGSKHQAGKTCILRAENKKRSMS